MTNDSGKQDNGSSCGCSGKNCCTGRGMWIWMLLALAVVVVLVARNNSNTDSSTDKPPVRDVNTVSPGRVDPEVSLPRLVDLGADKCIPCKMMAPILEDLRTTCAGKLEVQFIDVWKDPDRGKKYGIKTIPTQIFYDVHGKELFRHEGFFGKEDMVAKWKEFGVDLSPHNETNSGVQATTEP